MVEEQEEMEEEEVKEKRKRICRNKRKIIEENIGENGRRRRL
jgi:hypothetical protein